MAFALATLISLIFALSLAGCERFGNRVKALVLEVTDASSAPNHLNSPSPGDNEDNENGED